VEGEYWLSDAWSIDLPVKFSRRTEGDAILLWRPGFTARILVREDDDGLPRERRLAQLRADASPDAFDVHIESQGGVLRFAYRLEDPDDGERPPTFLGFAIGETGQVEMSVSFDEERDLEMARAMWAGLLEHLPAA
jgi:hypothetical protein